MALSVEDLSPESQAFYEHQTRSGSAYELIQRRDEIRTGLVNGTIAGYNRKAASLALATLQKEIAPPPTSEELDAKVEEDFIKVGARLNNAGDVLFRDQVLKSAGLSVDSLPPRVPSHDLKEREEKADHEFRIKRDKAIAQLQLDRGFSKREATEFFFGRDRHEIRPHPLAPKPHQLKTSMAEELMKQCNRNHALHMDRKVK